MNKVLRHEHLIVRALINNPPTCPDEISLWMRELVKNINMEVLAGPISLYSDMVGNRGLTSTVILNTSHAALHTWDEVSPAIAMLDVYSCAKLDVDVIFEMLNVFIPVSIEYKFLDRENSLNIIDFGMRKMNATSS